MQVLILAAAGEIELPIPTWGYGVIAGVAFAALMLVTFSYRNVANRHSHKNPPADSQH